MKLLLLKMFWKIEILVSMKYISVKVYKNKLILINFDEFD